MDRTTFLNLRRRPLRLSYLEASWLLNASEKHVALAVARGLLKLLGNPPDNGHKWLALSDIEELEQDRDRLHDFSKIIYGHWQKRNANSRNDRWPKKKKKHELA